MSNQATLTLSLLLMLAAFPLISIGSFHGPDALWWTGLAALAIGGALPPVRRFVAARREQRASSVGLAGDERVS